MSFDVLNPYTIYEIYIYVVFIFQYISYIYIYLSLQKQTLGALGFCTFYFFTSFSTMFFSLLKFLDLYQNRKINPLRRILGKSIQDCFCVFFLFLFGFFVVPSPTVQKLEENKKKQKKQSCEKNLG